MSGVLWTAIAFLLIIVLTMNAEYFGGDSTDNDGLSGVLFWLSLVGFSVTIFLSFVAASDYEHEKLDDDQVEIAKGDHHIVVFDNKENEKIYRSKKNYDRVTDTTTFYRVTGYNSWGVRLEHGTEIIAEFERNEND